MIDRPDFDALLAARVAEIVAPLEQRVAALERQLDGNGKKEWLTYEEAAERRGCTRDAIRMLANRGRLDRRYEGRKPYVSTRDVDGP